MYKFIFLFLSSCVCFQPESFGQLSIFRNSSDFTTEQPVASEQTIERGTSASKVDTPASKVNVPVSKTDTSCKVDFSVSKLVTGDYQAIIKRNKSSHDKVVFTPTFNESTFRSQMYEALKKLLPDSSDSTCRKKYIDELGGSYTKLLETAFTADNFSPQAGTAYLKRVVRIKQYDRNANNDNYNSNEIAAIDSGLSYLDRLIKELEGGATDLVNTYRQEVLSIKKDLDKVTKVAEAEKKKNKKIKNVSQSTTKQSKKVAKLRGRYEGLKSRMEEAHKKYDTIIKSPKDANDSNLKRDWSTACDAKGLLVIKSGSIQIQDGFIENVQFEFESERSELPITYGSKVAIPFSAKRDFSRLNKYRMYEFLGETPSRSKKYFLLSDVLRYIPDFAVNRRDYCPADTVLKLNFETCITQHALFKLSTNRLFTAVVFTDLMGVAEDKPNGLVQIEISRYTNLWTNRWQAGNSGWGFFNYVTPYFTQSKIENKERRLLVSKQEDSVSGGTYRFTSFLKLLEYQLFNTGIVQNLIVWDVPIAKSVFHLNLGIAYSRTAMRDSVSSSDANGNTVVSFSDFGVNMLNITPQLMWEIKPEERYGFAITERILALGAFTEKIRTIDNSKTIANEQFLELSSLVPLQEKPKLFGFINTLEVLAFFKPIRNQDQRLFFRYRLNSDLSNFRFNFHQLQLGYTINISTK